ncbi:MAG TPA: 3'(2'),5'-bisphosphate nucleotidase CysQ [Acidiferrobacter sp.]|nr:3'(2'),5'-bisphosphate nucleotidase CysQ [Acidiferrobacter sp.]
MNREYDNYLTAARDAAHQAALIILQHYQSIGPVDWKGDGSPVTPADRAAHEVILAVLAAATPQIPVASEEGGDVEATCYWSVDPLDGTKEYVARTGAFVVSIALVEDGRAVLGVIHVPVTGEVYFARRGGGAYKAERGTIRRLHPTPFPGRRIRLVGSARHGTEAVDALCESLSQAVAPIERTALGSAWKFGRLAEARADLYPRLGPTHTWDTAAGQCVLEEAGGAVRIAGRTPLTYHHPRQLNPSFVAVADSRFPWPDLLAPEFLVGR